MVTESVFSFLESYKRAFSISAILAVKILMGD